MSERPRFTFDDPPPLHRPRVSRFQRGTTAILPIRPVYGTRLRCECGFTSRANTAPSKGGRRWVVESWERHIEPLVECHGDGTRTPYEGDGYTNGIKDTYA